MPRKSAASTGGPSEAAPLSPTTNGHLVDGDTSVVSVVTEASTATRHRRKSDADGIGIDDLLLPRTLTSRLARGILPANTSIQKDALLALTKAATVFISHLASHANELTAKKTIGPNDVLAALEEIEMDGVMALGRVGEDGKVGGRLERELEVWEGVVRGKRKGYREKMKQGKRGSEVGGEGESMLDADDEERGEPQSKRAKMDANSQEESHLDAEAKSQRDGVAPALPNQQPISESNGSETGGMMPPPPPPRTPAGHGHPNGHAHLDEDDDELDEEDQGDDTQPDEDEEEEDDGDEDDDEENGEQTQEDELDDDVDGFGPDDQLRRDMTREEAGTDDESD